MFKLTVVTPEKRLVLDQEIEEVSVPAFRGELNILPGHSPMLTTLETGILRWKLKGQEASHRAVISWGYCEVHPDGVEVLADLADLPEEVDVQACQQDLLKAEKRLGTEFLDDEQWAQAQRQISRLRADIEVSKFRK